MNQTQISIGIDWKFLWLFLIVCIEQGLFFLLALSLYYSNFNENLIDIFRWNVHYVAQSDLDEIFQVNTDISLLKYLYWLESKHPAMASANFMSRRVKVPVSLFKTFKCHIQVF